MAARLMDILAVLVRLTSVWMLVAFWLCACSAGCVGRRMTIRSNPPGAVVYVDDYEIGTTPISTNFIYYGTRKIRLVKDGYETLTVLQPVPTPWYEYPVLDFFSENLVPGELRDRRTFTYQLRPQMVVPTDQLLERAEHLRAWQGRVGPVVPAVPLPEAIPTPLPAAGPVIPSPAMGPALAPLPKGTGGQPVHPLPPGGWPFRGNQ